MKVTINLVYFVGILILVALAGWGTGYLMREQQEREALAAQGSTIPFIAPLFQPSRNPPPQP
jgi:hypothetical protein